MVNIDAIKTKALRAVVKPDMAASLRRIFRWYSTTFHTPLHQVDDLPLEDVLQAYFEDYYSEMEAPLLEEEIAQMAMKPEERAKAQEAEEQAEEDFFEMVSKQIANDSEDLPDKVSTTFTDPNLIDTGDFDPLGPTTRKR